MNDKLSPITLAAAMSYTKKSLIGGGAVAGKNCTVTSITDIVDSGAVVGQRVTFLWTLDDGTEQTDTMDVMFGSKGEQGEQGVPGKGIKSVVVNAEEHLIITYDDDTTQDAGKITVEGGSAELTSDLTTVVTVGGIPAGTQYEEGDSLEVIIRDMLDPVLYPTLTNPSATLATSGSTLLEVGATPTHTLTATFNRGSINPAYGTSGYRAGTATEYSLNSGTGQQTNTWSETISPENKTFKSTVSYGAGEQPKDSKGNDYGTPLAAGSVQTNTITYEFVNALWANTSNIATVAKLALVSKTAKVKAFSFPSATVANPETFDVPANWTITALEVLNTLNNQWENCSSEFSTSSVTHKDAANNDVNYTRYTCNLGYAMGARQVRIKWS